MTQGPLEGEGRDLETSENATPQPPDEYSPDFTVPDDSSLPEQKGDTTTRSVLPVGDKKRPQRKIVDSKQPNPNDASTRAQSIKDDPSTQALMAELKALEANQNGGPAKRRLPKPLKSKPKDVQAASEVSARAPPKPLWMGVKHEARMHERRRAVEVSKPSKEDRRRLREYREQQQLRAHARMKQMQEDKERQQQLAEAKELEKQARHEKLLQNIAENQAAREERNQRRNKIMEEAKGLLTKDHVPLFKKLEMKFQVASEDEQRQKQEDYNMGRGKLYKMKLKDFLASPPHKPSASSDPGAPIEPTKFEDYMDDSPNGKRRSRTKGPRPPASAPAQRSHKRHANKPQDNPAYVPPPPAPPAEAGNPTEGISFADFMKAEKGQPKSSKDRLMKSKKNKNSRELGSPGPATVPEEDEDPLAASTSQATKQFATQEVQVSAREMSEERGCSPITFADRATSPCWIMAPTAAAAVLATALAQIQLSGSVDSTTLHSLRNSMISNDKAPVPSTSTSINNVIDEKTSNGAVDANNNNPTQESAAVLDETSTPPLDLATSAYGEPILLPEINDTSAVQPDDSGGQPSTSNQEAATEDAGSVGMRIGSGELSNEGLSEPSAAEAANSSLHEEIVSPRTANETVNANSDTASNQEDTTDKEVDLRDSDQANSQIQEVDTGHETDAEPKTASGRPGTPEEETVDEAAGLNKQEVLVGLEASASAPPAAGSQGSVDSPTAIDVVEEGVNNTAEDNWPEEAVEAEEACEEAPGSERLEELVAEETVADEELQEAVMGEPAHELKSLSRIGSAKSAGAPDSVRSDASPRISIVYPDDAMMETVGDRVEEASTHAARVSDGPLGEAERADSAKSSRSWKSTKSTACVAENVEKEGNADAVQEAEDEDENRGTKARSITSGASARSTEFVRLANGDATQGGLDAEVDTEVEAEEIEVLEGDEQSRSLVAGASARSAESVDSVSEVGLEGAEETAEEGQEVAGDWALTGAVPAESADTRPAGESAEASSPEEAESAPADERAAEQPGLEVEDLFSETEPPPQAGVDEVAEPEPQPEPQPELDIEKASEDLREAFAAHTLARRRVMDAEDLLKMVPGVSSDPRWVAQRRIRGVKTSSAAYTKMSGGGEGEFMDEPLDDDGGEVDDETRQRIAATTIQRYWGGHADRKHFVYKKARSELDKSQQRIDELRARYKVRENPTLQQLVFQLETEESQSMFSGVTPAPMAPRKQKMKVTAQPVIRNVRRGNPS
mmetsp:Transcript_15899/g.30477  ORF Transcript_15899/g.30477 Transcript_15899/m.30477 type:complete len:1251 (+) Transcript_15899:540-4292(+)